MDLMDKPFSETFDQDTDIVEQLEEFNWHTFEEESVDTISICSSDVTLPEPVLDDISDNLPVISSANLIPAKVHICENCCYTTTRFNSLILHQKSIRKFSFKR